MRHPMDFFLLSSHSRLRIFHRYVVAPLALRSLFQQFNENIILPLTRQPDLVWGLNPHSNLEELQEEQTSYRHQFYTDEFLPIQLMQDCLSVLSDT